MRRSVEQFLEERGTITQFKPRASEPPCDEPQGEYLVERLEGRDETDRPPIETHKSFRLKTIADLSDQVSAPYLIKGLMAPGELSVLFGEPSSGKSFAALWLSYRASLERFVFGRRTRATSVVYLALEGETGFERRVRAISSQLGRSERFHWITQSADLFGGDGDVEGIVEAIRSTGASLFMVDTYARAMGAGSENEGRDTAIMLTGIDRIRRETGSHVCLIHHTGKDATKGMRGHSSLLAAADGAFEVKRDDGARTLRLVKSKDGQDGAEHGFVLDVVELGADDDGEQITTCIVRETGTIDAKRTNPSLTQRERGWLQDLVALFAEPGLAEMASPASVLTQILCLTREQVREGFKRKGRFTLNPDGTLTGSDREKMRAALNDLKDKGKIGMTDRYVWLLKERQ